MNALTAVRKDAHILYRDYTGTLRGAIVIDRGVVQNAAGRFIDVVRYRPDGASAAITSPLLALTLSGIVVLPEPGERMNLDGQAA